ncbi:MAG: hypothetical protein ACM3JG_19005 [Thiohalocapsa sp.]
MRPLLPLCLAVVLPLLPLAACDEMPVLPPGPPPPASTAQLRVGFPPGGVADTIVVTAVERLPLRQAELVGPDGSATAASYLNIAGSPRFATGQRTIANPWHNSVAGDTAPAVAIADTQASAAFESRAQLLATVSTADIPLPDPVLYRRDWQRYHIRLTFGTPPGQVETRDLPAPAPPPP